MIHSYKYMPSPVGQLQLVADEKSLVAILWENDEPSRVPFETLEQNNNHPVLIEAEKQLNAYFCNQLKKFTISLHFKGTDFQKEVWAALLTIPYGETRSYAQIAEQIGRPKAVRAVGAANGKNPISIIAPCHRVIGKNGTLTGFAGGLNKKTILLDLESKRDKPLD